jgi:hypothetical protein
VFLILIFPRFGTSSAAYTDVLFFVMIPQENFTLAYDPALTWAQGEQLVAEFVAEACKRTSSGTPCPKELINLTRNTFTLISQTTSVLSLARVVGVAPSAYMSSDSIGACKQLQVLIHTTFTGNFQS